MDNVLFKQSFRGFDRTQVLKYIDDLSAQMSRQADEFRARQEKLEGEIDSLSQQLQTKTDSLSVNTEYSQKLEKDVEALKYESAELRRQVTLYRGMVSERDKEITRIKTEYNDLSEKSQRLRADNAEWKAKQDEIAACMVEASVRAKEIIASANRKAEKTRKEFEANASQLMGKVTDVRAEIASLERQLDDSFRKLETAMQDMDKRSVVIEEQVRGYQEKVSNENTFTATVVKADEKSDDDEKSRSKKSMTDSVLEAISKLLDK